MVGVCLRKLYQVKNKTYIRLTHILKVDKLHLNNTLQFLSIFFVSSNLNSEIVTRHSSVKPKMFSKMV